MPGDLESERGRTFLDGPWYSVRSYFSASVMHVVWPLGGAEQARRRRGDRQRSCSLAELDRRTGRQQRGLDAAAPSFDPHAGGEAAQRSEPTRAAAKAAEETHFHSPGDRNVLLQSRHVNDARQRPECWSSLGFLTTSTQACCVSRPIELQESRVEGVPEHESHWNETMVR